MGRTCQIDGSREARLRTFGRDLEVEYGLGCKLPKVQQATFEIRKQESFW